MNRPVPSPNLLPSTRLASRRRESSFHGWSIGIVAVLLFIAFPSVMLSIHLRASKPESNDHYTQFVNELGEVQDALSPLMNQLSELQSASRSQKISDSRVHWGVLLNHLASLTDDNTRINSFSATMNEVGINQSILLNIQTHTESLSQARGFLVVLEECGLFDSTEMLESRRISSSPDAPVGSTIRAEIVDPLTKKPAP